MKTVAILSIHGRLICHYFDTEEEALKTMPYIKNWERVQWDPDKIRYHAKSAEKFWRKRRVNDHIPGTQIIHKNGEKQITYY